MTGPAVMATFVNAAVSPLPAALDSESFRDSIDDDIDQAMRAFVEANLAPWAQGDYSHGFPVFGTSNRTTTRLLAMDTGFPLKGLTAEQIYRLWRAYRLFRFEEDSAGELTMSPTKGATIGSLSPVIASRLLEWEDQSPFGRTRGWSTFFTLPDHSIVMPQIIWMSDHRFAMEKAAPEFVIELRTDEEEMEDRLAWMKHLVANGTLLAWLIDTESHDAWILQPGKPLKKRHHPRQLNASPVLPGFCLDLQELWSRHT